MSLRRDFVVAGTGRHSGGFLLRIMPPSLHPVPACTPRLRCRRAVLNCSSDDAAAIRKSGLEIKNRCTQEGGNGEKLASIPKFGLKIKNRCTKEGVNREKHASILKSEPEIKNHCTLDGVSGQKLTSIRKSGLEIKNHCTLEDISGQTMQRFPSLGLKSRIDAVASPFWRWAILLRSNEE